MKKIIFLPDKLVIIQPKSQHKILYINILYVHSNSGLLYIHTTNSRKFVVEGAFIQVCKRLRDHNFTLAHRCHLVNLLHVKNIDLLTGTVNLNTEVTIPLARRRIENFAREWYQI